MNKTPVLVFLALLAGSSPLHAGTQPAALEIYDIQGNGPTSPHVGSSVQVSDSIVTAVLPDGFFFQTPDSRADPASSLTSNGIRVVTTGAPTYSGGGAVAAGHRVNVTGTVAEQGTETRLVNVTITRVGTGTVALPAVEVLSVAAGQPRSSADNLYCHNNVSNFECFEGMRVQLPEGVAAAGSLANGDVYVSPLGNRSMREKGVRFGNTLEGGNILAGIWDGNPEVLRMDPNRFGAVSASFTMVGGATFSATGVLTVDDGNYEVWPTALAVANNSLPVAVDPVAADRFRIASFDVEALCDANAGNTAEPCASPEPNSTQVATKTSRLAAYIVTVLGAPDVVALQNVETQAVLDGLASSVGALAGAGYTGLLGSGTSADGHDLAFLVKSGVTVTGGAATQPLVNAALFTNPPLLLEGTALGQDFRVLNIQIDDRDGVDAGTGGARQRRYDQALAIAELVDDLEDPKVTDVPLLVAGKFNASNETDGYVDVTGLIEGKYYDPENLIDVGENPVFPQLRDVVELLPVEERITAITTESFGNIQNVPDRTVAAAWALDHLLLSDPAKKIAMYGALGRGNADAAAATASSGTGAAGSSSFDGLVVDLYPSCADDDAANSDNDSWCDLFDNCPLLDNEDQTDTDGDLSGDLCDEDDDDDGIPDVDDNCPTMVNPGQEDVDGDGIGNVCDNDQDGDGFEDNVDNCPTIANPDGQDDDFDGDGMGDACDPNADMAVSFSASPDPVEPGASLTITATVSHISGPHTVLQPQFTLALPAGLAVQSTSASGWTCPAVTAGTTGAVLVCDRANLAPGASGTVTAQGTVSQFLQDGDLLTSLGSVTPGDTNSVNSSVEYSVEVIVNETDLEMDASGTAGPVNVGDTVIYTAKVTNLGAAPSEDVVVTVDRPNGTSFVNVQPPAGWTCSPLSSSLVTLTCETASVGIGTNATISFSLLVGGGATGTLMVVSPEVSASTADPNTSNNFDPVSTAVEGNGTNPDLIFASSFEDGET